MVYTPRRLLMRLARSQFIFLCVNLGWRGFVPRVLWEWCLVHLRSLFRIFRFPFLNDVYQLLRPLLAWRTLNVRASCPLDLVLAVCSGYNCICLPRPDVCDESRHSRWSLWMWVVWIRVSVPPPTFKEVYYAQCIIRIFQCAFKHRRLVYI